MILTIILSFALTAFILIGFYNTYQIIQIRMKSSPAGLIPQEKEEIKKYFMRNIILFICLAGFVMMTFLVNSYITGVGWEPNNNPHQQPIETDSKSAL